MWKYVKDKVLFHFFCKSGRIAGTDNKAVATKDADMIHRNWDEIAYRFDIFRVKRVNHVEHLLISVDKTTIYCILLYIS